MPGLPSRPNDHSQVIGQGSFSPGHPRHFMIDPPDYKSLPSLNPKLLSRRWGVVFQAFRPPCPGRDYGLQCFGIRATGSRLFASSGRIPSTNRVSSTLCGADRGSGFGTGGLQGDLLPEHYLFGEHRAVRVCSAQPSEGDISGMYEIRRAAFLPRAMCWCWPCSIGRISAAAGNS